MMAIKVLILGYVWPEANASAAGLRSWNLVRHFCGDRWEVHFSSPSAKNPHAEKLEAHGVRTWTFTPNDSTFDTFVAELNPDYVVFDRFVTEEQFGWRVREYAPRAVRVLDTMDLHFLRRAREQAVLRGEPAERIATARIPLATADALRETSSIYRSDCTLVLSSFEHELLLERFDIPARLLELSPFSYPKPAPVAESPPQGDFVMIGNFRHPPNPDGIRWFHREIWPLVRAALPGAEVHVYGAYPPREMMALTNPKTGFIVKGPAVDQYETLSRYRVNLAPLRFGAGIKGKIADGWYCGTPAVSTPIGAEGMSDSGPWGGLVAQDATSFAEACVRITVDTALWQECRAHGRRLLTALFDETTNGNKLLARLRDLRENLDARRSSNWTGAMLWHHQYRSTEYFSRWIELKEGLQNQRNLRKVSGTPIETPSARDEN